MPFIGSIHTVFRFFGVLTIMLQLMVANQGTLKTWFHAAHEAARDGRYLEGEVLLNYDHTE